MKQCRVELKPNEEFDSLLKRFKKRVEKAEVMLDARKHDFFQPKAIRRKEKSKRARIRQLRNKRRK